MNITARQSCVRTIKSDDPRFMIVDDFVMMPRAGFEISKNCPNEYKSILLRAIDYGYIKPVANVKDTELFWDELQK